MWLISWWVAWLMNFYGFSYKLQGMNIELHRYSMELHNIPYNSINSMDFIEFHGGISRGMLHINTADQLFKPYQLSYTSNLIEMYKHLITASTENCTVVQTYKFLFTFFVIDFFFLTSSSTALLTWLTRLDDTFTMSWIDKTHKAWKVFNNKQ